MVSQRLVDIVGEMEPDDTGGPLRPEVGTFLLGVLRLSWSGVRWAKGENSTGVEPMIIPVSWNITPLIRKMTEGHCM